MTIREKDRDRPFISLRGRLISISALFLFVSLLLVSSVTCVVLISTMRRKDTEFSSQYISAVGQRIGSLISDAVGSSTYLINDPQLRVLYNDFNGVYTPRDVIDELYRRIDQALLMVPQELLEITILTENYQFSRGNSIPFSYSDIEHRPAFEELVTYPGRYVLLSGDWTEGTLDSPRGDVYLAGIVKESDRRVIVVLKVKPDALISETVSSDVAITDLNGEIEWAQSSELYDLVSEGRGFEENEIYGKIEVPELSPERNLYYAVSRLNSQIYFGLVDKQQLRSDESKIIWFSVISGFLLLCLFTLLSIPSCTILMRPVKRLSDALQKIGTFEDSRTELRFSPHTFKLSERVRFKSRLIIFFAVLIIVSSSLCAALLLGYAEGLMEQQIEATVRQTAIQTGLELEFTLADLERSSAYMAVFAPFQRALENDSWSPELSQTLNTILVNQSLFAEGLTAVDIFDRYGELQYSTRPMGSYGRLSAREVDRFAEVIPGSDWTESRRDMGTGFVIPLLRRVRSINSMKPIGTIVFSLSESAVSNMIVSTSIEERGIPFVLDSDNNVLSTTDKTLIGTPFQDILEAEGRRVSTGRLERLSSSEKLVHFGVPIRGGEWDLVLLLPAEYVRADWRQILFPNISVVALIIVVLIGTVRGVSNRVVQPIETLMNRAKSIGLANLESEESPVANDEIGQLSGAFEAMLRRLHTLLQEVYVHEIKEKELERRQHEAQLRSLQYQINPHFLYNTFASIKFLIKLREPDRAVRMLTTLGKMFQRTVQSEQIIPIADEIEHGRAYLQIEGERYMQRLRVSWQIPDEILTLKTLKFILQPVLENAIIHGMMTESGRCQIQIEARRIEDRIRFVVSDDGSGMTPSQLARLRIVVDGDLNAQDTDIERSGIGIANVQERIHLAFGNGFGISIFSETGVGTTVHIDVPVLEIAPSAEVDVV